MRNVHKEMLRDRTDNEDEISSIKVNRLACSYMISQYTLLSSRGTEVIQDTDKLVRR